ISDILANPEVPRDRKRAEILLAAEQFRDDTSSVMTEEAWRTMSLHMGVENQGGPAVGFMPELPRPTVSYGAVMQHDPVTGEMTGVSYGEILDAAAHDHDAPAADPHAGHQMPPRPPTVDPHAGHEMQAQHRAAQDDTTRRAATDSAFKELMHRGHAAMGVDQEASQHAFESLHDGGRIDFRTDPADTASVQVIRQHLRDIKQSCGEGDFTTPAIVHEGQVPGTDVMAERREHIHYMVEDVQGGAVLRIHTSDEAALVAVHRFLAFQRQDHRTD